jgi:release factor glutamine methyltransferase
LEAEILLAEALNCSRIELYTRFDQVPADEPMAKFRGWVKQRVAGEPVAYIVGYREFYSLRFAVDSNVLIPRPETEHVVVAALEAAKKISPCPVRVLDIGTGSGCIAIALAKHLPDSKIAATDISPAALTIARQNAQSLNVGDKIRFLEGDLFDALPAGSGAVHLIVSNPPYIGTREIETVERQVKDFEPAIALFAGQRGTDVISRLVAEAPAHLLPGGFLIFETSPVIIDDCLNLVGESQLELVDVVKDLGGLKRVIVAKRL